MLPKVIMHNSVSLDSSFLNLEVNMSLHYQIAGNYRPDAHLISSKTAITGIKMNGEDVPLEQESDYKKPNKDKNLPLWVIIDTKGLLKNVLHVYRRFEFCKDVIILISEKTPQDYIVYLNKRNYEYHVIGKEQVDLKKALQLLSTKHKIKNILTDT